MKQLGTERVKRCMAEMKKGGVIMDVINAEQAKIAELPGNCGTSNSYAFKPIDEFKMIFGKC